MLRSRVVTIAVSLTHRPAFCPPPLDYTLIVDPFKLLKLKDAGPSVPVPLARMPYTFVMSVEATPALFTVTTEVRNLAFTLVFPGNSMPTKFIVALLPVKVKVKSSTRVFWPMVIIVPVPFDMLGL